MTSRILVSAMPVYSGYGMSVPGRLLDSGTFLTRARMVFVLINSLYSFYWDVARDWDLTLFSTERNDAEYPWGLRRHRFLHAKEIYYFAIVLDLLLRFTWTIKLSTHLDRLNDIEGGIFFMEALEVFRRWVWIFLRVETEWGRSTVSCYPVQALISLPQCVITAARLLTTFCWAILRTNRTTSSAYLLLFLERQCRLAFVSFIKHGMEWRCTCGMLVWPTISLLSVSI